MSDLRKPSDNEMSVIVALLQGKPQTMQFLGLLDQLLVQPMNDGDMGSLLLIPKQIDTSYRSYGKQIVSGTFEDLDGIQVSVAINVDQNGQLYELDVWKTNFASLISFPNPSIIKIIA